jgi:hypothetical protein
VVKVYEHNVGMYGLPRVRITHLREHSVAINIDAKGK